jgi:hypothetical protein
MEYKIITTQRRYFLVAILIFFILFSFYIDYNGPIRLSANKIFDIIIFSVTLIVIVALTYIIGRFFGKGEFKISMDNQGLKITWLKQSYLSFRQDRSIEWTEIKSYEQKRGNKFSDLFLIRTKRGKSFYFVHLDYDKRDHYKDFIAEFENMVSRHNISNSNSIKQTNYQSKLILWSVILLAIILIIRLLMTK